MRVLTAETITAKDSTAPKPVAILKIEFGGGTGTRYYADSALTAPVTAEARVLDWGAISATLSGKDFSPGGSVSIKLSDLDGVLRGLLSTPGFIGKKATVLQYFRGLGTADLVPLLCGTITKAPTWDEGKAELSVSVEDISVSFKRSRTGTLCNRNIFSKLRPEDEGAMLPIVYGSPHRVEAVLATAGAKTELTKELSKQGTVFYVKDASLFPSGSIKVRIGAEELQGSFSGNTFTVTSRACTIQSGTTSTLSGSYVILRDSTLPATVNNEYAGLYLKLTVGGRAQIRCIRYSVASSGALFITNPFLGSNNDAVVVPEGTSFEIASLAATHPLGETIVEVLDSYVFIAADHPVQAVDSVESWGIVRPEVQVEGTTFVKENHGHITLPSQYYSVNTNDSTSFPTLGHALATITMKRLPLNLPITEFLGHELFVSLRGREEDSALIENPVRVIEDFLLEYAGLEESEIDSDSFDSAATACSSRCFAFALTKSRSTFEIVADLAFQAGLALRWEEGKAHALVLHNDAGTSSSTLGSNQIEAGSVEITHAPSAEVVTEIIARYQHRGAPAALIARDPEAESEYGRRPQEIDFWAYESRYYVRWIAEWWLRRLRHRYTRISLTTFLAGLQVERGDTVTLDRTDLFLEGQKGRVLVVNHSPGNPNLKRLDRINLTLDLPSWAGCTSSCEHACESTACESASCELSCTAGAETSCGWTCETSCEEVCQLTCMSACELSCQGACMLSTRASGSCESSCESGCESGCEFSCEGWACETTAETGCALSCQSASTEMVFPVREVKVLNGVSTQYGNATAIQVDKDGNIFGSSFIAYDPFDVHPQTDEEGTVYLNYNYQWVFIPSQRNVKYVSVVGTTAETDKYSVREQFRTGSSWGEAFYAWAVDSV